MDIKENIMQQFLDERLNQYDKLFSSPLWRKSFLPFLQAHREMANRFLIEGKDMDVRRGMVLAFESIMNLPKAIEYRKNRQIEDKKPGPATDYDDSEYVPQFMGEE